MTYLQTVPLLPGDNTIDVRALQTANIAPYSLQPGVPISYLLSDAILWYIKVDIVDPIPDTTWRSNESPPRYRLGFYRAFYRGSFVFSEFLTHKSQQLGRFSYFADQPYLDPTQLPIESPPPPSGGFGIGTPGYGVGEYVADKVHIRIEGVVGALAQVYIRVLEARLAEFF